ncbi:hypothetical protein [Dietzia sp. KRD202]|uniref:hypothetical protein n=1 Tax=Dietzia sp. KRD202 TaxID=2729732 RepID=UPI0019D2AEDD|nr:hypothetical protein [Dietzia sp. KRD202]
MTRTRRTGTALLQGAGWVALALTVVALLALSGWATVRHSWLQGLPWWAGFRAEYLATPIAASIAAVVAITTAWWGVRGAHLARRLEHARWEAERLEATERTLRDRFHELIKLLSGDDLRSREGASYALAALADDWGAFYGVGSHEAKSEQQVCIDVLISQLRDPISAPGESSHNPEQVAFKQVIQKIISSRLGEAIKGYPLGGAWSSFDLVFDGCHLHEFVLQGRVCEGDIVSFDRTHFSGKLLSFVDTHFSGKRVSFQDARCTTSQIVFARTHFCGQSVVFDGVQFRADSISFDGSRVSANLISFESARLEADWVSFAGAFFMSSFTKFDRIQFEGNWLVFDSADFTGKEVSFNSADIDMRNANFKSVHFNGTSVSFAKARFHRCNVSFEAAHLVATIVTSGALFDDSRLSLSRAFTTATEASFASLVESSKFEHKDTKFECRPTEFPQCESCSEARPGNTKGASPVVQSPSGQTIWQRLAQALRGVPEPTNRHELRPGTIRSTDL